MQLADHIKVKCCNAAAAPLHPMGRPGGPCNPPSPAGGSLAAAAAGTAVGQGGGVGCGPCRVPRIQELLSSMWKRCIPRGETKPLWPSNCSPGKPGVAAAWGRGPTQHCSPEHRAALLLTAPALCPQFTQSALDCMGVEVCRLRAFLQVGGSVGWAVLGAPTPSRWLSSFLLS